MKENKLFMTFFVCSLFYVQAEDEKEGLAEKTYPVAPEFSHLVPWQTVVTSEVVAESADNHSVPPQLMTRFLTSQVFASHGELIESVDSEGITGSHLIRSCELESPSHDERLQRADSLDSAYFSESCFENPDEITGDITSILNTNPELRAPLLEILRKYARETDEKKSLTTDLKNSMSRDFFGKKASFYRHVGSVILGSLVVPHSPTLPRPIIRVLSIDGGGVRGIIPAYFLSRLEARFGMPVQKMFHFIAGTSAGGILATALSLSAQNNPSEPRFTATQLERMLFTETKNIFTRNRWSANGLFGPKYNSPSRVFERIVGKDTLFSKGVIKAMVTSYDLEAQSLKLIKNFRTTEYFNEVCEPEVFTAVDTMCATGAAPTFFPPHLCMPRGFALSDRYVLADGGIGANNPSRIILQEVLTQYPGAKVVLVSVGTGYKTRNIGYDEVKGAGLFKWLKLGLIDMLMGVPNALAVHQLETLFTPVHHKRTELLSPCSDSNPLGSTLDTGTAQPAKKMLRRRSSAEPMIDGMYFRFDPSVQDDSLDNAKESNLRSLVASMQRDMDKPGSMWHHLTSVLEKVPFTPLPN